MIKGARGECRLEMGDGEARAVLFTNAALLQAERELGKSLPAILRKFAMVDASIGECRTLLRIGMEAARRENHEARAAYTDADAVVVLDAVGYAVVAEELAGAITEVFTFGRKPKAEADQADDNPPE